MTPWRGTAANGSNGVGHDFSNGGGGGGSGGSGSRSGSRDGYRVLVDDPDSDGGDEIRIIRNIELESEGQVGTAQPISSAVAIYTHHLKQFP